MEHCICKKATEMTFFVVVGTVLQKTSPPPSCTIITMCWMKNFNII